MRPEVAALIELACHSAACAPPPAGTGGSVKGRGGSKGKSQADYDRAVAADKRKYAPQKEQYLKGEGQPHSQSEAHLGPKPKSTTRKRQDPIGVPSTASDKSGRSSSQKKKAGYELNREEKRLASNYDKRRKYEISKLPKRQQRELAKTEREAAARTARIMADIEARKGL